MEKKNGVGAAHMIFAHAGAEYVGAFVQEEPEPKPEPGPEAQPGTVNCLVDAEGPMSMDCDGHFFAFVEKNSHETIEPTKTHNSF